MLQNLLFKKPSSGGVIATLTMVAGQKKGLFYVEETGYDNSDSSQYGTLTPNSFSYGGAVWTFTRFNSYLRNNRTRYRLGVSESIGSFNMQVRIGETIVTLDYKGSSSFLDTYIPFTTGETYTIEILSITFPS